MKLSDLEADRLSVERPDIVKVEEVDTHEGKKKVKKIDLLGLLTDLLKRVEEIERRLDVIGA